MFLPDTPVLCYHRITPIRPISDAGRFAVLVDQFERQMRYLHEHGYHCRSIQELLAPTHQGRDWEAKTFALTFDDGYQDFFTQAYPILRRYGFTATVFLVTDRVGEQTDWEEETATPMLTWAQVSSLAANGITFGSHTCTHRRLSRLSREQVQYELTTSKTRLASKLGEPIDLLAYPYGNSNSEIQAIAMQSGYTAACGVSLGKSNRFNVWRRLVRGNDNLFVFACKLTHWFFYPRRFREETKAGQMVPIIKRKLFLKRIRSDSPTY